MNFKHFESIVSCDLSGNLPFDMDKMPERCWYAAPDGLWAAGDEHVQYAGVFARGIEAGGEEEIVFVWQAYAGSWVYQENFAGGV